MSIPNKSIQRCTVHVQKRKQVYKKISAKISKSRKDSSSLGTIIQIIKKLKAQEQDMPPKPWTMRIEQIR